MKKKVILLSLLVIVFAACFIPIAQQKITSIKAPFLNVYTQLSDPVNWEKWRPDLKEKVLADSTQISVQKAPSSFTIKRKQQELNVIMNEFSFIIDDAWDSKVSNYTYIVIPDKRTSVLSEKLPKTFIIVNEKISLISYLIGKFTTIPLSDTHIADLKNFMETDSLRYGCRIFKTKVPENNLIEIKKEVLAKNKFTEAAKMLAAMQQFLKTHDVKQVQPLIAQFLPKSKDSTQVNIGFYIDKEVKGEKDVNFVRMPKGGPLYAAKFKGKFAERQKVYGGLHQYFIDHLYQSAILPFETYLDNKLPASDTDRVNIQINFSAYF
ncbi:MAG: hypothetical protein JWP78_499 [Mucilaginibacter sp.]|nr:hypothetical protein [Mucilaginibacter sp.]